MNETLIEQIQTDVSALDIKITAQEIALYLSEKKVPPEHLEAMKEFIAYLRQNQRDKAINALLQHSRIPQKEPSTFENFDFSRITGENAVQIRNLPNLTALYSRQNIAFIKYAFNPLRQQELPYAMDKCVLPTPGGPINAMFCLE